MKADNGSGPLLTRELLERERDAPDCPVVLPGAGTLDHPVRAIMFGEGRFLRAFVGQFFQQANDAGLAVGRIAVVQPIAEGVIHHLSAQDGLYTVGLQGMTAGGIVDEARIVGSAGSCLSACAQWDRVVKLAASEQVRFIISNTTEAGIAVSDRDRPGDRPPRSFPAKVAALLSHRFRKLGGMGAAPIIFLPCELVPSNGDRLRQAVAELADQWGWDEDLKNWAVKRNTYINTLVDRIVTGSPAPLDASRWEKRLGYRDRLLTLAEPYHLWLLEGEDWLSEILPLHQAGINVRVVSDLEPYRARKVRLLNGAHTAMTALGLCLGLETVRQAMEHPGLGPFVAGLMDQEVCPTLSGDPEDNLEFSREIRTRFSNPFVEHRLTDIALNTSSKMRERILPSLLDARAQSGSVPQRLALALAANLSLYDPGAGLVPKDKSDAAAKISGGFDGQSLELENNAVAAAIRLLQLEDVWGRDLNRVNGLSRVVGRALSMLSRNDVEAAMDDFARTAPNGGGS